MHEFMWSPFPVVISTIAYIMLSIKYLSKYKLAKAGRILAIILLLMQIFYIGSGLYQKGQDGAIRAEKWKSTGETN